MKKLTLIFSLILISSIAFSQQSFYDFKVKDIEGNDFDLSSLKGKKVLVVNTASKCGLTPQYTQLQSLFETYGGEKFTIIGFPANNFMKQEPGTNKDFGKRRRYGSALPMADQQKQKWSDGFGCKMEFSEIPD
jgi:glutathione peroxidase